MDILRSCVICGRKFHPKRSNQVCCSKTCAWTRKVQMDKKWDEKRKKEYQGYKDRYAEEWENAVRQAPSRKRSTGKFKKNDFLRRTNLPKARRSDPKWIKDYCAGDRLTMISMLAKALSDYQIEITTYGKLQVFWGTMKYIQWENQVFELKRKEKDYAKIESEAEETTGETYCSSST